MIRAVLAVAMATALLGVALPGIDHARVRHSDRVVRGEIDALDRAARSLVAADEAAPTVGARRTVTVTLPDDSWGGVAASSLAIRGSAGDPRATVTYRLAGHPQRTVRIDTSLSTPDGPVVLRESGSHRIVLELVRIEGRPVVRVHHPADADRPGVYTGDRDHTGP